MAPVSLKRCSSGLSGHFSSAPFFTTCAFTLQYNKMSKPGDFSSQSYAPSGKRSASNPGQSKEKDDMVGLNNKFVQLIDKVSCFYVN